MKELSKRFPLWLCDVWGVVHDGHRAIKPAVEALMQHRASGGRVVLITNAPRPKATIAASLVSIGITDAAYDDMITSGDATRKMMVQYGGEKGLYHLGPAHDLPLFDDLPVRKVPLDVAGAVVCTGFFDKWSDDLSAYDPMLEEMQARDLTMICANPDKVVRIGTELVMCAGSIAEVYEKRGGKVLMAGKPFAPIYDLAMQAGAPFGREQALAIGDGPETDIAGAQANGLPCVFISGGINGHGTEDKVRAQYPEARILASMHELAWT